MEKNQNKLGYSLHTYIVVTSFFSCLVSIAITIKKNNDELTCINLQNVKMKVVKQSRSK